MDDDAAARERRDLAIAYGAASVELVQVADATNGKADEVDRGRAVVAQPQHELSRKTFTEMLAASEAEFDGQYAQYVAARDLAKSAAIDLLAACTGGGEADPDQLLRSHVSEQTYGMCKAAGHILRADLPPDGSAFLTGFSASIQAYKADLKGYGVPVSAIYCPPAPPASAAPDRVCPFCAETIKAAAIICRFCGRDVQPTI